MGRGEGGGFRMGSTCIPEIKKKKKKKQKERKKNRHMFPAAAAAAKSLQLCPTLCDPRDGSPPGSPVPGIL